MHTRPRRTARTAVIAVTTVLTGVGVVGPSNGSATAPQLSKERPFRVASYWNTPLGNAPRDRHSRSYIRDAQISAHSQNFLKLVLGDWAMPTYRSGLRDPVYRINPLNGPTVRVHIPRGARPMPTSDAAMTVRDMATHQVIGLGGARFHKATH